jgi:hypothetical protein
MGKLTGGYDGSPSIQTSTANLEIIPQPISIPGLIPSYKSPYANSHNVNRTCFYEFSFYNTQACHVKVNGENVIYLAAGENWAIDSTNTMIWSFIVIDSGINYTWVCSYE